MASKKLTVSENKLLDELRDMANFLKAHNPNAKNIHLNSEGIERLKKIYEKGFKLVITKSNDVFSVDGYEIKPVR